MLDTEVLIKTIEKHEVIWSTDADVNLNNERTISAWNSVCEELIMNWCILSDHEKLICQRELRQRWFDISEYYKNVFLIKSHGTETGFPRRLRYVYADLLRPNFIKNFEKSRAAINTEGNQNIHKLPAKVITIAATPLPPATTDNIDLTKQFQQTGPKIINVATASSMNTNVSTENIEGPQQIQKPGHKFISIVPANISSTNTAVFAANQGVYTAIPNVYEANQGVYTTFPSVTTSSSDLSVIPNVYAAGPSLTDAKLPVDASYPKHTVNVNSSLPTAITPLYVENQVGYTADPAVYFTQQNLEPDQTSLAEFDHDASCDSNNENTQEDKSDSNIPNARNNNKQNKPSLFEGSVIYALESISKSLKRRQDEDDPDFLFLKSMIPTIKQLDDNQKFKFKFGVLQMLRHLTTPASQLQTSSKNGVPSNSNSANTSNIPVGNSPSTSVPKLNVSNPRSLLIPQTSDSQVNDCQSKRPKLSVDDTHSENKADLEEVEVKSEQVDIED